MSKTTSMEYEKVIDYIDELIKNGDLCIGTKLPTERVIAEHLGIGRNSTREALSILHGMGMIRRVQGSGNYVTGDAHRSIRQICTMMLELGTITKKDVCEFRRVLEKSACMLLATKTISVEEQRQFEEVLDAMETADEAQQPLLDRDFHALLLKATGNSLMITILEAISEVYQEWIDIVIHKTNDKEKTCLWKYHKMIFRCLVDQDTEQTLKYVDNHYDLIEEMLNYEIQISDIRYGRNDPEHPGRPGRQHEPLPACARPSGAAFAGNPDVPGKWHSLAGGMFRAGGHRRRNPGKSLPDVPGVLQGSLRHQDAGV